MKVKNKCYRGMYPASIINFLSNEDTPLLTAGFFIIVLVLVFSMLSCGGGKSSDIKGTWGDDSSGDEIKFENGDAQISSKGSPAMKGPYTASGGKITIIIAEIYGGHPELAAQGFDPKWYSKADFKALGVTDEQQLNQIFPTFKWPYSLSGGSLTMTVEGDKQTFAKIGDVDGASESGKSGSKSGSAASESKASGKSGGWTWTAVENSPFDGILKNITTIAFGNGKFVAGGDQMFEYAYSSDGKTWTASDFGPVNSIAFGNGKFVAAGSMTSSDGVTWTKGDEPFSWGTYAIAFGNGKFVAGGVRGGKIAYSSDGVNWTAVNDSKLGDNSVRAIAYGDGKFVAASGASKSFDLSAKIVYSSDGKMAYSSDGVTWTEIKDSALDDIRAIAFGNGKFVAGGYNIKSDSHITVYSSDLKKWTTAKDDSGKDLDSLDNIVFANGIFVGVTASYIYASTDGVKWTKVGDSSSIFSHYPFNAVAYGNGTWVVVGFEGKIAYSTGK